jgi:nitronate monooxygenase
MNSLESIKGKLSLPVIVSPMFIVSTPKLALACCREGLIGSFAAHSARSTEILESWLEEMQHGVRQLQEAHGLAEPPPYAVNLVVHPSNPRFPGDLDLIIRHRVPVVLTSKGAPGDVFDKIQSYGGISLHDVATRRHAEKALEAGTDGLIAVCGGAGGHTGRLNPFALMNEVLALGRRPVVLAGAISTGRDIFAAEAMGADLVYMGTRFICTEEANAAPAYRDMICRSSASDIITTAAIDGAPAAFLKESLLEAGIDLDELAITRPGAVVSSELTRQRYKTLWSAGHGVGAIHDSPSVADLVKRLKSEYMAARLVMAGKLATLPLQEQHP